MRKDSKRPRWTAAVRHLRTTDPTLARLIDAVGPCRLAVQPADNPFLALCECIVYQQLTAKAAATIFGRFRGLYPGTDFPSPQQVLETPEARLRQAGLSGPKLRALHDLAAKTSEGALPLSRLGRMSDPDVIEALTQVRGIGVWSAQMYLIFRLGRPDVLPVADLGVRKGIQRAYALDDLPPPAEVARLGEPWKPYRSIATWYFWASLAPTV